MEELVDRILREAYEHFMAGTRNDKKDEEMRERIKKMISSYFSSKTEQ